MLVFRRILRTYLMDDPIYKHQQAWWFLLLNLDHVIKFLFLKAFCASVAQKF